MSSNFTYGGNMKKGEMLSKAIVLATNKHAGQFDKGGNPYILHPLTVMHKLKTDDEELQCIAVLHDVIEDTDTTWEMLISEGMTDRVVAGVMALTKQRGQSLDLYKKSIFANRDAMLVKREDLRTNSDLRRLKGVSEKDIARTAKYMIFYSEIEAKLKD